jgi:uncharacterized surface anchored protein
MESTLDFNKVTGVKIVTKDGEGKDVETTIDKANYTLTPDDEGEDGKVHGFALKLRWGTGAGAVAASTAGYDDARVVVEFNAILNQTANIGKPGNANAAQLAYSNTPDSADDHEEGKTPWDYAIAFTYKVDINKVDQADKALSGAEFRLQKKLADGSFATVAKDVKASTGTTFSFRGLDDGLYVLTETTVPAGYKGIDPISFEVRATHDAEWKHSSDAYQPTPAAPQPLRTA